MHAPSPLCSRMCIFVCVWTWFSLPLRSLAGAPAQTCLAPALPSSETGGSLPRTLSSVGTLSAHLPTKIKVCEGKSSGLLCAVYRFWRTSGIMIYVRHYGLHPNLMQACIIVQRWFLINISLEKNTGETKTESKPIAQQYTIVLQVAYWTTLASTPITQRHSL